MEFCSCGGMMIPQKGGAKPLLICRKCGKKKNSSVKAIDTRSSKAKTAGIVVVERKQQFETQPKTIAQCPKCENKEAYWWMIQTRASDEPPTRFFRCTKCKHVWREYE